VLHGGIVTPRRCIWNSSLCVLSTAEEARADLHLVVVSRVCLGRRRCTYPPCVLRTLVVTAGATLLLGGCGEGEPNARPSAPGKRAVDRETDIAFVLRGRDLEISVTPTTPTKTLRRLRRDHPEYGCGEKILVGRQASAVARSFSPGVRRLTVRLDADIERTVGYCVIEGRDPVGQIAIAGFKPFETLVPTPEEVRRGVTTSR
jgi:hypothetical protein